MTYFFSNGAGGGGGDVPIICNKYLRPTARMPETILYAVLLVKELRQLVHISQSII